MPLARPQLAGVGGILLALLGFGSLIVAPRAARAVGDVCVGECNQQSGVTVDELITGVNIALDKLGLEACPTFDVNGDGHVTIDEIVLAVNNALTGCLLPTFTAT